jgi:hypothetical protein
MNETEHFIPSGMLVEIDGKTQLRYVTLLTVDSPDLLQEQIQAIFEGYIESWFETDFSGDVYLQGWNNTLDAEDIATVDEVLQQIIADAQDAINSNKWTSATGHPIQLRATVSNTTTSI